MTFTGNRLLSYLRHKKTHVLFKQKAVGDCCCGVSVLGLTTRTQTRLKFCGGSALAHIVASNISLKCYATINFNFRKFLRVKNPQNL